MSRCLWGDGIEVAEVELREREERTEEARRRMSGLESIFAEGIGDARWRGVGGWKCPGWGEMSNKRSSLFEWVMRLKVGCGGRDVRCGPVDPLFYLLDSNNLCFPSGRSQSNLQSMLSSPLSYLRSAKVYTSTPPNLWYLV